MTDSISQFQISASNSGSSYISRTIVHINIATKFSELAGITLSDSSNEVRFDKLIPHYAEAVQRAAALEVWQKQQGREGENPSTAVYELTERIIALARQ